MLTNLKLKVYHVFIYTNKQVWIEGGIPSWNLVYLTCLQRESSCWKKKKKRPCLEVPEAR